MAAVPPSSLRPEELELLTALRPEQIEAQLHELENSIAHLHRSNEELRALLAEDYDLEFATAVVENEAIIERRERLAHELRALARQAEQRQGNALREAQPSNAGNAVDSSRSVVSVALPGGFEGEERPQDLDHEVVTTSTTTTTTAAEAVAGGGGTDEVSPGEDGLFL